ncbi:758_t:CDS:1, partial [Paraglomus occultum]
EEEKNNAKKRIVLLEDDNKKLKKDLAKIAKDIENKKSSMPSAPNRP